MTRHDDLIPYARVFVGDLTADKYLDDTIMLVLRVTTAVLRLLGYRRGHTSDPTGVTPDLSPDEHALWGKCAAVLLQDPKAAEAAVDAVSVRTLGTSYSTEARARFLEAASSEAFSQLRTMLRSLSEPLVGTVDNLDIDTFDTVR